MAKFIAVHPLKTPVTGEEVTPLAKKAKAGNSLDAYWVSSWLQLNDEGKITKIFCEWDAKDTGSVSKALAKSIPELPVEGVYPMAESHGESYR
jgi:hypothetical protein